MTAKEALRERTEQLSEEDARAWLERREREATESEELTDEERERWLEGKRQIADGDWVDGEEFLQQLKL